MKTHQNHVKQITVLALSLIVAWSMGTGAFAGENDVYEREAIEHVSESHSPQASSEITPIEAGDPENTPPADPPVEPDGQDTKDQDRHTGESPAATILDGGWPEIEGDTNGDERVDIVDMSNIIDWFGITADDDVWEDLYMYFDYNGNGEINIDDIACISRLIGTSAEQSNRKVLEWLIARTQSLPEENYTTDSWSVLAEALEAAIGISANSEASGEEIDEALQSLQEALRALEEPTDLDALTQLIETAQSLQEADYTANSWSALEAALESAIGVSENSEASGEEVAEALYALQEALRALEEPTALDALIQLIETAQSLHEGNYTAENWSTLKEALEAAIGVSENSEASGEEVAEALHALREALRALEEPTELDALTQLIETAQSLQEGNYTADSWSVLAEALASAIGISENSEASGEEIAEALHALQEALRALEEPTELDALTQLIEEAQSLQEADYTADSWSVFREALDAAIEATETEAQEAVLTLREAMDALVAAHDSDSGASDDGQQLPEQETS